MSEYVCYWKIRDYIIQYLRLVGVLPLHVLRHLNVSDGANTLNQDTMVIAVHSNLRWVNRRHHHKRLKHYDANQQKQENS
jgi:hypothetical protein